MRTALIVATALLLSACASKPYRDTADGKFSGALDVRWVSNDYFLFMPNKEDPFTFARSDGRRIRPGPMFTDGGSIPRFLWGLDGYSPWGYAPAYIVHDWLFEAHQCGLAPDNQYSFEDSVTVMAESLKAVMERFPEFRNDFVFNTVVAAIATPLARRLWDNGSCNAPSATIRALPDQAPPGELVGTIRFP